jgi:hypothetical protein
MHLTETTHEHATNAKVYTYDADYAVEDDRIEWTADVRRGTDFKVKLHGSIPMTSPGLAAVAEEAVRDAVVAQIDAIEDAAAGP